ncbi:SRPBCC family protein [Acidicapsa dinghuensis]|uniref:SRPBCC family protein n=1 Tax=Acidicapsa dinghuensis TaxID=2218256 RepID=A0ABW1EPY6_9BACT|nr:SRPBCC family protein [Acidicapsa dinghuensis]
MTILQIDLLRTIVFLAAAQGVQQGPAEAPLQIPNPHYATIEESIVVDAPVDKVWARVGRFCDITEWMNSPEWADCKYLQGDGGPGTVRSIVNEVLVGQTQYSYTYAQPPRKDTLYNLAHGTLSAEPLMSGTTRLTYTMLRDDSILPGDAARQRDSDARHARVSDWLKNMKVLAEAGKLPPKPAGNLRPPITTPLLNENPHYASLPMSIEVNAPIEEVWARIGKYCDIGEWAFQSCDLLSGKEGEIEAVRTIGHSIIVGQTRYSYTYTQPLRIGGLYPMYHGTLEARSLGPNRTTIYYTLVWDDSVQPDEAARQKQINTYHLLFEKMLRNMKKLAE